MDFRGGQEVGLRGEWDALYRLYVLAAAVAVRAVRGNGGDAAGAERDGGGEGEAVYLRACSTDIADCTAR